MAKILQDISFGDNLKKIRKAHGLTQEEVCARLSAAGRPMLRSTYGQIEIGIRNIFVSDLIALKTIFNVSYDEFFEGLAPVNKYDQGYE